MSVINKMLRDLDQRGATLADRGSVAATPSRAYAATRMAVKPGWPGRRLALAAAVSAMLPLTWAATQFVRPAAAAAASEPMSKANPDVPRLPAAEPLPAIVASPARPPDAAPPAADKAGPGAQRVRTAAAPAARVAAVNAKAEQAGDAPPVRVAMAAPAAAAKDEARIERRPTDARDDLTRAGEAMATGRVSDALALLQKVIQAEPQNERARLAWLALLAERGRDDTWRSALAESARAMPARFGVAAAQGWAESGRFEQSLAILQAVPDAARDLRYFSALGATQQQLSQHADAVRAFDAALALAPAESPQLPSLLVAQAVSMRSLGQAADARRNFERVRQMPEAPADVRNFATRELATPR